MRRRFTLGSLLTPTPGSVLQGGGNPQWWHAVFPNTTCNATLCASAPDNPSNKKCCAACLAAKNCGQLTNTTDYVQWR